MVCHKASSATFITGAERVEHSLMPVPAVHLDGAEGSRHDRASERVERAECRFGCAVMDGLGERLKKVSVSMNGAEDVA